MTRDQNSEIFGILHKWGVQTVGQFAALDKEAVSRRLGSAGLRLWERATGTSVRLLKLIQPPESFAEAYEFEHEVETIDPLLFILRRFLEQIATRLTSLYLVAEELSLQITFGQRGKHHRIFSLPQPTNDVDLLFRILYTHLESFKSEHPITAVSLEARPTRPLRQQFGLFETALRNPTQLSETLARLIALLGPDRVGSPVVDDSFQADAFHLQPFQWNGAIAPACSSDKTSNEQTCSGSGAQSLSPVLRRFRPNRAASVLLEGDVLLHLRSAEISGAASAQNGPYLSSGNWWDEKHWERSEWDVELDSGSLLRCHQNNSAWQVDGVYD